MPPDFLKQKKVIMPAYVIMPASPLHVNQATRVLVEHILNVYRI